MKILLLLFIAFAILPCKSQTEENFAVCDSVLVRIQQKDYEGFKKLFPSEVLENVDDAVIKTLVDQAAGLVSKYGLPKREMVMINQKISVTTEGQINMLLLDYPFPAPKEKYSMPDRVISFGFSGIFGLYELSGFNIKDYAFSDSMMTAQMPKIPFLESFKFEAKDIKWFRIYYSKGASDKKIGNEDGVFAVSGDSKKLKKLNLENQLSEIFTLLKKAEIEKTFYKYGMSLKNNGRPEYIYFRFSFNHPPMKDFDELTIKIVIEEEAGIPEDEYIILSHNQMNRYYISKSQYPELFEKLKALAYLDYGDAIESDP